MPRCNYLATYMAPVSNGLVFFALILDSRLMRKNQNNDNRKEKGEDNHQTGRRGTGTGQGVCISWRRNYRRCGINKGHQEKDRTSVGNVREAEEIMEIKQHINQNKD